MAKKERGRLKTGMGIPGRWRPGKRSLGDDAGLQQERDAQHFGYVALEDLRIRGAGDGI